MIHKPYLKFKGWLKANSLTYKDLGELLGLSTATVSAKINGQSDFLLSEVQTIKSFYNLDDTIFLKFLLPNR